MSARKGQRNKQILSCPVTATIPVIITIETNKIGNSFDTRQLSNQKIILNRPVKE